MTVHGALGPGFLESVYKNALAQELQKAALSFEIEKHIEVVYDGVAVGRFVADMLVENRILLELKAAPALSKADSQQLVNYLKATKLDVGLLLNFGSQSLEFRRKQRTLPGPDLRSSSSPLIQ